MSFPTIQLERLLVKLPSASAGAARSEVAARAAAAEVARRRAKVRIWVSLLGVARMRAGATRVRSSQEGCALTENRMVMIRQVGLPHV